MAFEHGTIASKANGGTEQLVRRLESRLDSDLLSRFQIVVSRKREPLTGEFRIAYCHDLATDPQAKELVGDGRWAQYDRIVFVSNWQMQQYNLILGVPYAKSVVIENFIDPIDIQNEYDPSDLYFYRYVQDEVRLIYTPTPHRGLEILVPVYEQLIAEGHKLHLDVFSSFNLYAWPERDKRYQALFERCESHPNITYHGTANNATVREAISLADIFAYPSIWQETSCLCLIEAMSAGLYCVHPNYGALADTAMGLTDMYQWHEDPQRHAEIFYEYLKSAIAIVRGNMRYVDRGFLKRAADARFNTERAVASWESLLNGIIAGKDRILAERRAWDMRTNFSFKTS